MPIYRGEKQPHFGLTPRRRDIIERVADAKTNKEIAAELGVSENSIKQQLSKIFLIAGVTSRLQLAIWRLKNGKPI